MDSRSPPSAKASPIPRRPSKSHIPRRRYRPPPMKQVEKPAEPLVEEEEEEEDPSYLSPQQRSMLLSLPSFRMSQSGVMIAVEQPMSLPPVISDTSREMNKQFQRQMELDVGVTEDVSLPAIGSEHAVKARGKAAAISSNAFNLRPLFGAIRNNTLRYYDSSAQQTVLYTDGAYGGEDAVMRALCRLRDPPQNRDLRRQRSYGDLTFMEISRLVVDRDRLRDYEIVSHRRDEQTYKLGGLHAGQLWRMIRELQRDRVVVDGLKDQQVIGRLEILRRDPTLLPGYLDDHRVMSVLTRLSHALAVATRIQPA